MKKGEKDARDPKLIRSITGMEESEGGERKVDSRQTEVEGKEEKKSRDFLGTALVIGQSAGLEIMIRTELAGFNRGERSVAVESKGESRYSGH